MCQNLCLVLEEFKATGKTQYPDMIHPKLFFLQLKHRTPALQKLHQQQLFFTGVCVSYALWALNVSDEASQPSFNLGMLTELSV